MTGAEIIKGLSPACDAAAVARLPRFVPARRNGRAVVIPFTLLIYFYGLGHAYKAGQLKQPARLPRLSSKTYLRRNLRRAAREKKPM